MKKFAFIIHPLNVAQIRKVFSKFELLLNIISDYRLKSTLEYFPNLNYAKIRFRNDSNNEIIEGYIILCPLTPNQFVSLKKEVVFNKILSACKLAERLGAKVVGLGGFTSIMTNGGVALLDRCDINITNGNTFTACVAIESIIQVFTDFERDIKSRNVMILGATGDIGTACSNFFAGKAKEIYLIARDMEKLRILKDGLNCGRVTIGSNYAELISQADIIITATSALTTFIKPDQLKSGAILCDVSYPPNINMKLAEKRSDILVYAGGLIKFPNLINLDEKSLNSYKVFNSSDIMPGCLAETILLTLEGRFENFSVGRGGISSKKINYIKELAIKYKFFEIAYLSGNSDTLTDLNCKKAVLNKIL